MTSRRSSATRCCCTGRIPRIPRSRCHARWPVRRRRRRRVNDHARDLRPVPRVREARHRRDGEVHRAEQRASRASASSSRSSACCRSSRRTTRWCRRSSRGPARRQLRHDNVAQTYELGKVGDTYFIAMELIEGPNLREILNQCCVEQAGRSCRCRSRSTSSTRCCDALDYAHNLGDDDGQPLGIIHRDVSPSNVIVADGGIGEADRLRHREGRELERAAQ